MLWTETSGADARERLAGRQRYLDILARLHNCLKPTSYLEVGVRRGASLALASCPAIGVDPQPEVSIKLPDTTTVVEATSDAYFQSISPGQQFDLIFIDGLHLFEQTLRDFMNAERVARPGAALLIDDVFPNHSAQAERRRQTQAWTGDVWKLVEVLRAHRPDLFLAALDAHPAGMLLVAGLDPKNRTLESAYPSLVQAHSRDIPPPAAVLQRFGSLDPTSLEFERLIDALAGCYREQLGPQAAVGWLRAIDAPALSVVIISHEMERELPRTIRSFSPAMQREIAACDYELVVVDNGSRQPPDASALAALAPNLALYCMKNATVSPVQAVNFGLERARGGMVGVCIDGARMASPGLLASAVAASKLHPRPVIGSIAFHLGPEVQMQSINKGYNQAIEDELLAASGWDEDGYNLFDVSVFAGSSNEGWFVTPAETNALFLRAEHWRELGGFDARFESPGGGLVNLDTWARACEDPTGELIMLLGEATFHQVHGGIATNNPVSPWKLFHEEYVRLRGKPFARPTRRPRFYGGFNSHSARSVQASKPPA